MNLAGRKNVLGGPHAARGLATPGLDNRLVDGGKVVRHTRRPYFTPQKHDFFFIFPVLISEAE
jgi:hypothetical protein